MNKFDLNLKQTDIEKMSENAIKWIISHWQTLASATGVIIAFAILGIYFVSNYNATKQLSWEKISYAQGVASQGMTAQAIQILDDIISKYSDTDVGQFAKFIKADISFREKNYNLAANLFQEIINNNKAKNLTPFAYSGLGYCKENTGDYQGAISAYKDLLEKYPNHYILPRVYDSLGRVYLLSGSATNAKETYEKLITLYPGTYWSTQVQKNFATQPQTQQPAQQPIQQK